MSIYRRKNIVKNHYENLLAYFKNLVWLTTGFFSILALVGGFFFYSSMSDLKNEINELKDNARYSIKSTNEMATLEISLIRERAKLIAVEEAKRKVEETFRTNNVESIIKEIVRENLASISEQEIRSQVLNTFDEIQNEISVLGKIADSGVRMRLGFRSGMEQLIEFKKSKNERVRNRAKSIFNSITTDYENTSVKSITEEKNYNTALLFLNTFILITKEEKANDIPTLLKFIETNTNCNDIAVAFLALRQLTSFHFNMFDFKQIEVWCKNNPDICK